MGERILLIEDDPALARQIVEQLREDGLEVTWWPEGRPIEPATVDLVILDLMLPGLYGMDILKMLRPFSDLPVIILSGRNDTIDKVRGLKLGADDYMTKPFWPAELVERIRARLRRPAIARRDSLRVGALELCVENRTVLNAGIAVELTKLEFDLLAALMRRPGAAITRAWLVAHVMDSRGTERTLDVHFSRLRKKLGEDSPIETVWGVGYRVNPGSAP